MSTKRIPAPDADEYAPFYAGYVAQVRERDPVGVLERQVPVLHAAAAGMTDGEALERYAPGKWSIKQVLGHLGDTERVFSYRLLRIARGDDTPLAGFDENDFVAAGGFEERSVPSLLRELDVVRASTLQLVDNLPPEAWPRRGTANGIGISAGAILYIVAGHMEHHFAILRERYGLALPHVEAPRA